MTDRRSFLQSCAAFGAGAFLCSGTPGNSGSNDGSPRRFHASISIDAFNSDPGLPDIVRQAGVSDVWLACFFQGQWRHSLEEVRSWKERLESKGLAVHQITIPFGHPTFSEAVPDYMPPVSANHWKPGIRPDGRKHYGVALHDPITAENVEAIRRIKETDPGIIFLDDDFRLAPGPGDIGGCFCEEHKQRFLARRGLAEREWSALLEAVRNRETSPLLEAWVEDLCDDLTECFREQQKAALPDAELGIMVMYLGSEKAGIRLSDYTNVPFRVGELMFDDKSFSPVKGKTNELFSSLFHRRFVSAEKSFSETTAWPPDGLSAENMAAKLAISTLSDVRNTMFMSGNTPFPRTHWEVLAPSMEHNRILHGHVAGGTPRGPFKHYWGRPSRYWGDANPFSLFLALGVPFEVVGEIPPDGWTFLSDFDARESASQGARLQGSGLVYRPDAKVQIPGGVELAEDLGTLFAWRRQILPTLIEIPFVEEEEPVVCSWLPDKGQVLLWNLVAETRDLTVRFGEEKHPVRLSPLGVEIVSGLG